MKNSSNILKHQKELRWIKRVINSILEQVGNRVENYDFQRHVEKMSLIFNGFTTLRIHLHSNKSVLSSVVFYFLTSETYLYVTIGVEVEEEDYLSNVFLRYEDLDEFRDKLTLQETKEKILGVLRIVIKEALKNKHYKTQTL